MQFFVGIFWDLVWRKLTAPRLHLLGAKPDAEIHELNESRAVRPPEQTELLNGEKKKWA
jgi:hypothetical protein